MIFKACKYGNKWAVLDTKTKVYYDIGKGKKYCTARANELNQEAKAW